VIDPLKQFTIQRVAEGVKILIRERVKEMTEAELAEIQVAWPDVADQVKAAAFDLDAELRSAMTKILCANVAEEIDSRILGRRQG
jgi:hypothetical protein